MATATISTRSIQGESLSAANDRLVNTALLREGVIDFVGDSYKVAQDTGSNMQVKIGSGTAFDRAVVEGDNAGQGTFICEHANATQTLAVAAADATNPRIDIVVLRVYDDTFDSSGLDEADLEVIQGTPAVSPSAPATPDSALKLAEIEVGAGVTAITDANITDSRYEAPVRGELVETLYFTADDTFEKADYPWLRTVRAKVVGSGGGGAGAAATGSGQGAGGGGGGGGAYAEKEIDVSELSASETVTVGEGGAGGVGNSAGSAGEASSFGAHVSADGGGAGSPSGAGTAPFHGGSAGSGGTGGTGDIVASGQAGEITTLLSASAQQARGGSSPLAGHHSSVRSSGGVNGSDAVGYGVGGDGAANAASQSARNGGDGFEGIVILELYA